MKVGKRVVCVKKGAWLCLDGTRVIKGMPKYGEVIRITEIEVEPFYNSGVGFGFDEYSGHMFCSSNSRPFNEQFAENLLEEIAEEINEEQLILV